jgi:hypothetical protein
MDGCKGPVVVWWQSFTFFHDQTHTLDCELQNEYNFQATLLGLLENFCSHPHFSAPPDPLIYIYTFKAYMNKIRKPQFGNG